MMGNSTFLYKHYIYIYYSVAVNIKKQFYIRRVAIDVFCIYWFSPPSSGNKHINGGGVTHNNQNAGNQTGDIGGGWSKMMNRLVS